MSKLAAKNIMQEARRIAERDDIYCAYDKDTVYVVMTERKYYNKGWFARISSEFYLKVQAYGKIFNATVRVVESLPRDDSLKIVR